MRVRWRLVCALALGVTAFACTGIRAETEKAPADGAIEFFDAATRGAFGDRRNELARKRTPTILRVSGGDRRISTCAELLPLVESGLVSERTELDRAFSEYQICLVFVALERARVPRVSHFDHNALGAAIFRKLNLATLRSSLYPRARDPKKGFTFSDFKFSSVKTSATALEIEDEDWNYGVTVLAAADCDGDGVEDLVVSFYDDAKSGRYFQATTLILHRTDAGGWISADPVLRRNDGKARE